MWLVPEVERERSGVNGYVVPTRKVLLSGGEEALWEEKAANPKHLHCIPRLGMFEQGRQSTDKVRRRW